MKILLLYAHTGWGHGRAAHALIEGLADDAQAIGVEALDVSTDFGLQVAHAVPSLYRLLTTSAPFIYNLSFLASQANASLSAALALLVEKVLMARLREKIENAQPDLVLVLQPLYVAQLVGRIRESLEANYSLCVLVTDPVNPHRSWFSPLVDRYFFVSPDAAERADKLLEDWQSSHVVGYPVDPSFLAYKQPRNESLTQLGYPAGTELVLLTGGGAGAGPIGDVAHPLISQGRRILVAVGENDALRRKMLRLGAAVTSRDLHAPISASVAVLGKAGPATIFECAALGASIGITSEVGIQEVGNTAFAVRLGVGVDVRGLRAIEAVQAVESHRPTVATDCLEGVKRMKSAILLDRSSL